MDTDKKINDYINSFPEEIQDILNKIRKDIKKQFPKAEETFSYKMISFKHKKHFLYLGAFKKHIGIYPPVTLDKEIISETKKYRNEKGNLSFPLTEKIPFKLIINVAKALAKQYE